jgi:hypothetical protein
MSIFSSLRTRIPAAMFKGAHFGSAGFPELTQVLVGRNDGYGYQPWERMLAVIEWNRRYLKCKTVFVEWNPPEDKELLSKRLTKIFPDVYCYIVKKEIHLELAGEKAKHFQEFYAKNAGIRRAKTKWIMVTNTDVIIGSDILNNVVNLHDYSLPRTRRVDIPFPQNHKTPSLMYMMDGRKYLKFRDVCSITSSAPGDCTIATRELWEKAGGYDENTGGKQVFCDCRGMLQLAHHGGELAWVGTHFHFDHPDSSSYGINEGNHGAKFNYEDGIPYKNNDTWGLKGINEKEIGDRIFECSI